ncbi:MAG: hypothetical protein NTW21_12975 [Verrucomicrobia bacterium]|nr:hypothetical protein [Verrucomicrobiota bacterium]
MNPSPPLPEGPSVPPRHRPSLDIFVKNTSEQDFWDLDVLPATQAEAAKSHPARAVAKSPDTPPPGAGTPPLQPIAPKDSHHLPIFDVPVMPRQKIDRGANVHRHQPSRGPQKSPAREDPEAPDAPVEVLRYAPPESANQMEDTFDNLEHWDLADETLDGVLAPAPQVLPVSPPAREVALVPQQPLTPAVRPAPPLAPALTDDPDQDEFSPAIKPDAKPISLRPKLHLSKLDSIGLILFALILLGGGCWVYHNSISRLLSQSGQARKIVFPVQGNHVTVTKVTTYWREPIKKEAVRRGVVLIPVTELSLRGGPGAIRVQVYNDNGRAVGDPITCQVTGETTLELPATDGFDDISMHAAYSTGQTKAWTVRIFEAPAATSQGLNFKKLLEVPVSTRKQ